MNNSRDPRPDLINAEQQGRLVQALALEELRTQRNGLGDILCELHNAGLVKLTSDRNLLAIEELAHNEFWIAVHPLNEAIPHLNCPHREILAIVHMLVKKAGSDGAAGMPNLSLGIWSKNHPEEAGKIIDGIKGLDDLCLAHGVFVVAGLGGAALAFDLIRNTNNSVSAIGLRALGRIEIMSVSDIKKGVDDAFGFVERETDPDLRAAATEAAFRLWEKLGPSKPYRQREFIETIGTKGGANELSLLSAMLFYYERALPKENIDQVLGMLETLPSNSAATLSNLDHAIKKNDDRWDFKRVAPVFAALIPGLDKKADKRDYHSFASWAMSSPQYASYLFAAWLNGGEFALCSFLADLLSGGPKGADVWIQKQHLPAHANDQIFIAQKCVGFLWHHEVAAAAILLSIVKHGQPQAQSAAEKLLFDPLLLSYGGNLRDFLEKQCSNASKRISSCAKRLLSKHDTHIAGLERARDLVELLPSIEHRRAVAMKDRDRNRDIQKLAQERSIFASLVTHHTLLYGRKSFSIVHGAEGKKHPNISALSEISHSVELPRLMVIDPVGFNARLTFFRAMKRRSA
ncbi:MAG: hypothetical protein EOS17_13915 [Mesorhizobium sp.]|nr:MAG: hypothetical protein EOS17_13915 [Mesorhizobium sp.]